MSATQTTFWQGFFTLFSLVSFLSGVYGEATSPGTVPTTKSTIPRLVGINLPGFEFGAQTDGQYTSGTNPAMPPPETQIDHFLKQGVNLVRVPVAWKYLQPEMNGKLNETNLKLYQTFIEEITSKSDDAFVAIDLHSYARYDGQIVGQSPSTPDTSLVSLWTQLGEIFKDNKNVMFGISNEPHDLDIMKWAATVQKVVTALREKDINNILLIPGTDYTSMKAFPEWYKAMKVVKNPDGSFDGLIMELHRYLDSDNSGKSTECVASHADEVAAAAELLKADGRQAILAETGGGSTASCEKFLPELAQAVTEAYPVFGGFAMWAAGAFDAKYELVTTVEDKSSSTGWKDMPNWLSIKKFIPAKGSADGVKSIESGQGKKKNNKKKAACRRQLRA